ncbi:MAG: helix-turn-helix domain-containing protein [Planctomycetes bacterium]|jgi:AraC-like DNA-binding protein|nr:helix-turn-helix domain-containing protein [Planctomycetota bacterium]
MARTAPLPDDPTDRDAAIRALCAAVFASPGMLVQALTHPIDGPWVIAPHTHEHQLQFDLLEHCAGRVMAEDQWSSISGTTALVSRPGTAHGYELAPSADHGGPGRVYHVRLKAQPGLAAPLKGVFPAVAGELSGTAALVAAMRVVIRLGAVPGVRPPMLLARLAEAFCLWPGPGRTVGEAAPYAEPEQHERGMSAALDLIDKRLHNPPSIDELASVAHFSVRHFARRFHAAMGCTPHTYITARRFALARQVLSQDRLKINQVAEQLGFGSVATFSRWFSQQAGVSPSKFREDPAVM